VTHGEWREATLGDLLEVKHGYAFSGEYFGDSGTHIVLTPGNFYDKGGFKSKGQSEKWYSGSVPSDYVLSQGDVVIAMTEQAEGLLGSSAIVPQSGLYLHNQRLGLVKLRDPSKTDIRFIYYLFNSKPVRQQIRASASGAKIRHTAPSRIASVRVRVPLLSVQQRVAEILAAYDELIENNQRCIRILEEMARVLYREWFVEFRFPGHKKVQHVARPAGEMPRGWEVKPFAELASYINGYAFKPNDWGVEGKPIVKIRELKAGVAADTPRNSGDGIPEKYSVRDGDVLFSWSADLDVYLWTGGEALLNQHLFNVVPLDGVSRAFCFHALKEAMPRFRALSLGATMQHIKRSALDQVSIALPPEALRKRFDELVVPMHQQVVMLNKRIENLRCTRDLLLPRLLEGRPSTATANAKAMARARP
jgi:type I restriction enzyme S subunit